MASLRNYGVQVQEFVYDVAVDGGSVGSKNLHAKDGRGVIPVGAIIKGVTMKVVTAFTSSGSATLSWGNGDSATAYSGTAIAVASLTDNAIYNGWDNAASALWDDTNDHAIYFSVDNAADGQFVAAVATEAMLTGKAVFLVEYYHPTVD